MKTYRKSLMVVFCFLYISTSFANPIGEHPGEDTGTGSEIGGSGGNTRVFDGGRNAGKGGDGGTGSPRAGSGGGGGPNNNGSSGSKAEAKPELPVVRLCEINCGVLNQPMEGVVAADRLEEGKVVEHVELQTDNKLEETANTRQDSIISDGFASDSDSESRQAPIGHPNEGLEDEAKNLGEMAKKAKDHTQRKDVKSRLDELLKFAERYTAFQNKYNNSVGELAKDLSLIGDDHNQSSENISNKLQGSAKNKNVQASSSNAESAPSTLGNISNAILDFIGGSGTASSVSTSLTNFFKSMFNKNPVEAGPYVNEALRVSLSGGQPKVLNLIEPVREKLMHLAQGYLAPELKIQYSKTNRDGPLSFDCSGFVTYIYKQVGLDFSGRYGRAPKVIDIIAKRDLFYKVDVDDARNGDLVVHLKSENPPIKGKHGEIVKFDDHIGIYIGKDEQGNVKEISATTRGKDAKRDLSDPKFRSSIAVLDPIYFGETWHIYRWNK